MKKIVFFVILYLLTIPLFSQGIGGYCLYYDGDDDYLVLPDVTQLNGVETFTISFWVKQNESNDINRYFYKINGTTTIAQDISIAYFSGNIYFEVGTTHNTYGYCPYTINPSNWFHVAAVYDGALGDEDEIKLFIDGVEQALTISGDIPDMTHDLDGISAYVSYPYENSNMGSEYFGGYLDELRIWDYARPGTEINNDMNTPLTGSETGLVAYWKFDENGGQTAFNETVTDPTDAYDGTLGSTDGVDDNDPSWVSSDAPLPVNLSAFYALYIGGIPTLYWTTQSEENNEYWNVYRGTNDNFTEAVWLNANDPVPGNGTVTIPSDYVYIDTAPIMQNTTYWYWIEDVSTDGETEVHEPITLFIPFEDNPITPGTFGLHQNYPNPFNPSTSISFTLEEESDVELIIYNVKGARIRTIFNDHVYANDITSAVWDGKDAEGKQVSSGVYLYKLITETKEYQKKMLLAK